MSDVPEITPDQLERLGAEIDCWWCLPSHARRVEPNRVLIPVAREHVDPENRFDGPPRVFDHVLMLDSVRTFSIEDPTGRPEVIESIEWSPAAHLLTLDLSASDVQARLEGLRVRVERAAPESAVYGRRGGRAPSGRTMRRVTARLSTGEERRQLKAVKQLRRMPADHGAPLLHRALDGPSDAVAAAAARALGDAGHQPAVDSLRSHLERALEQRGENDLGWSCAAALADLGAVTAVPALRHALRHHDLNVRFEAARALGRLGAVEATPDLRRMLEHDGQDEDDKVLEEVVGALALLSDRDALERARNHPRHSVRVEAKDRLRFLAEAPRRAPSAR